MPETDGKLTLGADVTQLTKGLKEAEKAVKGAEKAIGQAMAGVEDAVSKRTKASIRNLETLDKKLQLARIKLNTVQESAAGRLMQSEIVAGGKVDSAKQMGANAVTRGEQQRKTDAARFERKRDLFDYQNGIRQMNKADAEREVHFRKVQGAMRRADKQRSDAFRSSVREESDLLERIVNRAAKRSPQLEQAVKGQLMGFNAAFSRQGMVAQGSSLQDAFISQLSGAFGARGARNLVLGGRTNFGGPGGGGPPNRPPGGGGIIRRILGAGGGGIGGAIIGGLASGFGIGLGGMAIANMTKASVEAIKVATAYERQMVAARNLAGSQSELNGLLDEYQKASGGAVSKVASLAAVTRLMATGFAQNRTELGRFVRGSRGASIALGRPQEEVTQDIQLAISNTSVKRLDQIGLGIKEVNDRVKELRKTNADWTRETAFGEAVLALLDEKYGKLTSTVEAQATGVEKLAKAWDDLFLALGKAQKGSIGGLFGGIAGVITSLTATLEKQEELGRVAALTGLGRGVGGNGFWGTMNNLAATAFSDRQQNPLTNSQIGLIMGRSGAEQSRHRRPNLVAQPRFRDDQFAVISQGFEQFNALQRQYEQARLEENRSFNQSMADAQRNYQKSTLREEQDFHRTRARGLRDYEKSILTILRDGRERDAEIQEDLGKQIARMKRDSNRQVQDIEEQYQEDRQKAAKDHRDALLEAAGQLDAIAILAERKRWAKENEEREKQHKKQLEKNKENLDEQIKDAEDSAAERIDDARKADEKRLADMAADRKQQLADEDEDRAIRKARAEEDFNDELASMAAQHDARMEEIKRQEAEDAKAFQEALQADLTAVGIYIEGYTEKMKQRDKLMEEWFDKYLLKIEKIIQAEQQPNRGGATGPNGERMTEYAKGGPVYSTGPAFLHAGEYVLNNAQVAASGGFSGINNSRSISIGSGAISIQVAPGSEYLVGELLEEKLVEILGRV